MSYVEVNHWNCLLYQIFMGTPVCLKKRWITPVTTLKTKNTCYSEQVRKKRTIEKRALLWYNERKYHRRNFYGQKLSTHKWIWKRDLTIEEGKTLKEIGERLGFTREQIHNFITRYNEKQRKIAAGIVIKKKGRPSKDYQISEKDSAARLRYIIDRKDARIKSLEMENELMRDFLLLTGRKWGQA